MQRPLSVSPANLRVRRGVIVPLVAVAILVVGGGIALVLDRLWLASAKSELLTVAEGASLAACRQLIDEDRLRYPKLRPDADERQMKRVERARQAAGEVATTNTVAGQNVKLDLSATGDVRFGKLVRQSDSSQVLFLETEHEPSSALVTAYRTRSRNNPVALLFQELTGQLAGDVAARAEASWGNQVVGLRPHDTLPAPVLPITVLEDSTNTHLETWTRQIEQFQGQDRFGYDLSMGTVTKKPDGVPEIVLTWSNETSTYERLNHAFIELGKVGERNASLRQLKSGWRPADLESFSGEIRLDPQTIEVWGRPQLTQAECRVLTEMIGECRIVCLCRVSASPASSRRCRLTLTRFAGARIMSVEMVPNRKMEIVLQPVVVVTRTALLATAPGDEITSAVPANPYIYKIQVTQ